MPGNKTQNKLIASKLNDKDAILNHLNTSLLSDVDDFLFALQQIMYAQGGYSHIGRQIRGLSIPSLYKTTKPGNKPRFESLSKIVNALGYRFQLVEEDSLKPTNSSMRDYSLAYLYPQLAIHWDTKRNGEITPNDVMPGSRLKVWWRCPLKGHEYKESPCHRIINNILDCLECNHEETT